MASVNKVTLVGNLGSDPEVRYLPNGDAVANFRIATTERYKDRQTQEMKEATEWHTCVAFRRLGEIVGEFLKKGSSVYLEGRLRTRKFDKNGVEHYRTEVVIDEMQMLGGRTQGSGDRNSEPRQSNSRAAAGGRPAGSSAAPINEFDDDQIPF